MHLGVLIQYTYHLSVCVSHHRSPTVCPVLHVPFWLELSQQTHIRLAYALSEAASVEQQMTVAPVASLAHTRQGAPFEEPLLQGTDAWAAHVPATAVDAKDADTPDNWVPRDPRILRLTGRHPLNCEPPMDALMGSGFITPPSIHYVRNHGAVPKLEWSTHRIEVNGLVDKPLSISMDELLQMPAVRKPITLVCAGNRRKEENMIKKSIGFNWGPCAVSTSYWTGVRLGDIIRAAGITPDSGAGYVCFRGPLGELPKGSDGSYGTSLRLSYALDDANDVLICYKQNDRWLTPDHGFPVRIIIPGFIGGRMVKWLSEITVTREESNNHYHYFDNRVMPPHVDEALATKEGWWYQPDWIINDLNTNSAVARPWHDELLSLATNQEYQMAGYAYTGGGRKVIRVEVSLDSGVTWRLAEIKRFEEPNEAGKLWCWVHWTYGVQTAELSRAKEILVRAWDSAMNTQPALITWNLMGMMNNCHFRILISHYVDQNGGMHLRFQHPAPVEQGNLGGIGWREEENLAKQGLAAAAAPPPAKAATAAAGSKVRLITMGEVEKHNSEESAWFVHEGKVYDATPFLEGHPGGAESILISAGMDATEDFNAIHSSKAKAMLVDYYIGELATEQEVAAAGGGAVINITADATSTSQAVAVNGVNGVNGHAAEAAPVASTSSSSSELVALNPRQKIAFRLAEKEELSHDTRRFRFALQSDQHKFGLPCGKHVFLYATINGESVMRAYTPTSQDSDRGHFDLVIKVYRAGQHPQFPEGGKMSQHLESLSVGDTIDVKGPVGHVVYEGRGLFTINRKPVHIKRINLLAGGTGITPCWQVLRAMCQDPEDTTQVSLVYANQTPDDILLRTELEELANNHPDKFKLWYTCSRDLPDDWSYSTGYIDEPMLREHLLEAGEGALCAMCGPPGMIDFACVPNLTKLGFTEAQMVLF